MIGIGNDVSCACMSGESSGGFLSATDTKIRELRYRIFDVEAIAGVGEVAIAHGDVLHAPGHLRPDRAARSTRPDRLVATHGV